MSLVGEMIGFILVFEFMVFGLGLVADIVFDLLMDVVDDDDDDKDEDASNPNKEDEEFTIKPFIPSESTPCKSSKVSSSSIVVESSIEEMLGE